jgi:hypothetical protein
MPSVELSSVALGNLRLTRQAIIRFAICGILTLFGVCASATAFVLAVALDAASPRYWQVVTCLLVVWFATLLNMYRHAFHAVEVDRIAPAVPLSEAIRDGLPSRVPMRM